MSLGPEYAYKGKGPSPKKSIFMTAISPISAFSEVSQTSSELADLIKTLIAAISSEKRGLGANLDSFTSKKQWNESEVEFWNCRQKGHNKIGCPKNPRRNYCRRCCKEEVTTKECDLSGNYLGNPKRVKA
ncbi:uncharacterized protein LOC117177561 [Belonocnema kinseyi]|uniref:uncharacterized protein LOC117177561 n=1 Tax=Belonocnema kinseyi TaxID=2817044 RepID=UPI00143D73E5|nr:uncharacterized protein LOC117177561 [Belonocnema kinseyi]